MVLFILGRSRKPNKPDSAVVSSCLYPLVWSSSVIPLSAALLKSFWEKSPSPELIEGHRMQKAG